MKHYLDHPIIKIQGEAYLSLLICLAPLLNFLSGLNIDMYAPSMPAIANHFAVSAMAVKNTMTIEMFGMALGSIIFGTLIDTMGRKRILMAGLFIYTLASFTAPWCNTFVQLLFVRFIQGFTVASISIGCRALIVDSITGPRYAVAILYTSVVFGFAPIIGPFIGGIIQYHFNWQTNFIAFGIVGFIFLSLLILFVKESIPEKQSLSLKNISSNYWKTIKHKYFMAGIFISAISQIELMIYPTLAPFVVENILHKTALVYGNTALVVGGCYLVGALLNRILLRYQTVKKICELGCWLLIAALILACLFALFWKLNLLTMMIPLILMGIANGLLFPSILGTNISFFTKKAGIAMAIQYCLLTLFASVGLFIISHFHINRLAVLAYLYTVLIVLQLTAFFMAYRSQLSH